MADARVAVVRRFSTISKCHGRVLLLVGAVFSWGSVAPIKKSHAPFTPICFTVTALTSGFSSIFHQRKKRLSHLLG